MNKEQANETLRQLGGNRFIAMTRAKMFVRDEKNNSIWFKIGKNSKGINLVKIKLNSMDLYDLEFIRVRAGEHKIISESNGVYNDMLEEVFTHHTGLYTRL